MTELALIASNPTALDRLADPGEFVIQACERAKTWLAEALAHGDIEQIVELKSQAEAIRVYTAHKQLGHDAELSAAEIVRRAERGIGLAIRRGQEAGTIIKRGRAIPDAHQHLPRPTDFVSSNDLSANGSGIYQITDGVTEMQFDVAIAEARAEGNLSRANVARKVKPESTPIRQPKPSGRKRRPITDAARDAGWALRKDVEKVERIFSDDRFTGSKKQVTAQLHGHLTFAVEALTRLLDHITQEGE